MLLLTLRRRSRGQVLMAAGRVIHIGSNEGGIVPPVFIVSQTGRDCDNWKTEDQ
jgi:hypothetical protein